MKRASPKLRQSQRGAATLIVVMVLFFIISLVAAYTSRNLIFEQRTSANQYRSTQALEAAEAGLEWAITLLNFRRITSACIESVDPTDTSFRQRYLDIDGVTGKITPDPNPGGGDLTAACVFNGTRWNCSCPSTGAIALAAPAGTGVFPAFRVRFQKIPGLTAIDPVPRQPGVIRIQVVGCTRLDAVGVEQCLTYGGQGATNEGRAVVSSLLSLTGNLSSPPQAALTARGQVNAGGAAALTVSNSGAGDSGITVQAGANINSAAFVLQSLPGSPSSASLIPNDPALNLAAAIPFSANDRMFAAVFNVRPQTFQDQQGAVQMTCGIGGCTADAVRAVIAMNPGRPLWLNGDFIVDTAGNIGSSAEPVLMVVNGNLQFTTAGVTIFGLVYTRLVAPATAWVTQGAGQIQGAVVAEGDVGGGGTHTIAYDGALLTRLRVSTGSFVRVPNSWKDYQ